MRARILAALMAVLLFAWPAAAQEQRGSIEGTVKDTSGAILPGVTVEAKSAAGNVISTTSDASGQFRFPSLAPGLYEVTANLASFAPQKFSDVQVGLGQIKRLEFGLSLAGVAETVSVTAESPLVDIRNNARQVNIRAEQVDLLPHGRDFTTLVTQAPGANQESKLGGLSIDGASAGENRYIIDGIETTNLQSGTSGKSVIADFVEEVQVKSSGYTAEFGGATGGVINVVTKSGTNNLHGLGMFNVQGSAMEGSRRPSLRIKLTDSNASEYITYPEDDYTRIEPAFALGGPIASNKAWYYGAYQPALTTTDRSVSPQTAQNPAGNNISSTQKEQIQFILGNVTNQFGQNVRSRVSFNNSYRKLDGLLPALAATERTDTNYGKISEFPNWSLSGNVDWTASPRILVSARGGYYNSDVHDSNVTEQPLYRTTTTSSVGLPGVPANLQIPAGYTSIPSNTKTVRDQQTRAYFQADATTYASFGGEHQLKFGMQVDRVGNNVLSGESRPRVTLQWNTALSGQQGRVWLLHRSLERRRLLEGLRHRGQYPHEQPRVLHSRLVDDQSPDDQRRSAHRARERPDLHYGQRYPRVRHQVQLRRQARTAPRRGVRPQGRWPHEGVRILGCLLRHLQARAAPRFVRRRQVARLQLHARDRRLAEPSGQLSVPAGVPRHTHQRSDRLPSSVVRR